MAIVTRHACRLICLKTLGVLNGDMNRFFTFGCSFTEYAWPTWADIVGQEFDEYENWGRCGAGNLFISNQVVECHLKNTISANDTVAIMWTNITREDRYINRIWETHGNILTGEFFPDTYIKQIFDVRGFYVRDLALMYSTKVLLESIGCKYYFFSMVPVGNSDQYNYTANSDLAEIDDLLISYSELLNSFYPSVFEEIFNFNWQSKTLLSGAERFDNHPTPMEHLQYIKQVAPELYALISSDTFKWVSEVNTLVEQNQWGCWENPYTSWPVQKRF